MCECILYIVGENKANTLLHTIQIYMTYDLAFFAFPSCQQNSFHLENKPTCTYIITVLVYDSNIIIKAFYKAFGTRTSISISFFSMLQTGAR